MIHEHDSDTRSGVRDVILHHDSARPLLLSAALVEELHVEFGNGPQVARGDAEIGGILIAPRRRAGWIHVVRLEPIQSEYRFGPSFQLSAPDFDGLGKLVASIGDTEAVVGFYRSWTCGETGLRDSDREICQTILEHNSNPADFRYLMLLTSKAKGVISAEVALRENGDWDDWQTYALQSAMPAPVSAPLREEKEKRPETPGRQVSVISQGQDVIPSPESVPEPQPRKPAAGKSVPRWIYGAAASIVLSGGIVGLLAPRHSTLGVHAGFAAHPEGGMWKLTWNRDSVAAMHPSQAILSILDGDQEQLIPLTTEDLASGSAYYMPQGRNLIFELQLLSPDEPPTKEQIRVFSPDPASVSR